MVPAVAPDLLCRVEIPKGSRNKYEYDEALGAIKLDRFLFSSVVYPADYGFIPDTLGGDGDALDAMVCLAAPTFPGCLIEVRAVGMLRMRDAKGNDDKIICVPLEDPNWDAVADIDDLSEQFRNEIRHFFAIYKELEGERVDVEDWHGHDAALEEIEASRRRFAERD
jgi:inorganic pyrophosphatase